MSALTSLPIAVLSVLALCGLGVAALIAKRVGRVLNFRSLLICNYVAVQLLSGLMHLSGAETGSRGYYDLLANSSSVELNAALTASICGMLALCVACLRGVTPPNTHDRQKPPALSGRWLTRPDKIFVTILSLATVPLILSATIRVRAYAETSGLARVIKLDGGLARYSFMSHWAVWIVSFLAIWLLSGRLAANRLYAFVVAGAAALLIVYSLAWTGGRSIAVVMVFPLMLVLIPRLRAVRWLIVPAAVAGMALYVISVTLERSGGRAGFDLATWLDWQWGRFSLTGYASEYVHQSGYLYGETFLAGFLAVITGAFRLIGGPFQDLSVRSSQQIFSQGILGSTDLYYIEPGLTAELYVNFGLVGVVAGYFVLGRLAAWADRRFEQADNVLVKLLFAYVGTLLVFRTVAADSGAISAFLLFSGLPLLLAALFGHVMSMRRREASATAVPTMTARVDESPGEAHVPSRSRR